MSHSEKLRILSYDISSNKLRRRIARRLEEDASRVQYSVFEARLTDKALRRIVQETTPHLEEGDSLRVYTIGRTGERYCKAHGTAAPIATETGYWLL